MKATELMLNDLVMCNNKVCKVCSIEGVMVLVSFKDGEKLTIEDNIEPVPLTPEILEKNGFRWTGSGDRTMMCGTPYDFEGIRYNLYVGLGKKYIEVHAAMTEKKDERWRKVNKTYLEVCGCYVNELQHALKLCGIDKEIIL